MVTAFTMWLNESSPCKLEDRPYRMRRLWAVIDIGLEQHLLESQLFRQSHFRLIDDLLQAREAREGKSFDWNGADFADRRFVQSRPAAFSMDQRQHHATSPFFHHDSPEQFQMLRFAEPMVARHQIQFNGIGWIAGQQFLDKPAAPLRQDGGILYPV